MKNIHLIPTDKPSRLTIRLKTNELMYSYKGFANQKYNKDISLNQNQHIYITNSEEIKEGQNYIGDGFSGKNKFKWHKSQVETYPNIKKDVIFLTTDQDLIKDGVQSIDDGFLEWFVKNPSCESVEVETTRERNGYHSKHKKRYKIIIPKEPKQETLEEAAEKFVNNTRYRNYKVLFIEGAKSDAARDYWFKIFKEQFIVNPSGK
jgi:hypothetical protein